MTRTITLALAFLAGLPLTSGCAQIRYDSLRRQYERDTKALTKTNDDLTRNVIDLNARLHTFQDRNEELEILLKRNQIEYKPFDEQQFTQLLDGLRDAWKNTKPATDLDIRPTSAGFELVGDTFFAPGQWVIKEEAKKSLKPMIDLLKEKKTRIGIAGHTDNTPIRKAKTLTGTNLELGALRALSVFQHFQRNGIPAERMHIRSYGEHAPVDRDRTPEAFARNRRVEILLER